MSKQYSDWSKAAAMQNTVGLGQASIGNTLAEREKEIPSRLNNINYELGQLEDALNQLRNRLQPITSPRPEEATKAPSVPSGTSIGTALSEFSDRIRMYTYRVHSMLGELEI